MNNNMNVEKVIEELTNLKSRYNGFNTPYTEVLDNAIQTIRALQELTKGLSETHTSNPMYELGYKKGATDMEKAKQIIIDKLQEQLEKARAHLDFNYKSGYEQGKKEATKWHYVANGDLPKDDTAVIAYIKREITDVFMMVNISSISGKWQMWESDRDLYDDEKVIAWRELPKFEEVE